MKTLKYYTITKIDQKNGNLFVDFVFEENEKELKVSDIIHYDHELTYIEYEKKLVPTQVTDESGFVQTRMIEKDIPISLKRKAFDVSDTSILDEQMKAYAKSYSEGLEREKIIVAEVSPEVKNMVGIKNI